MTELPQQITLPQEHDGGENLEAMREARNYNRFLCNLGPRHARNAEVALVFGAGTGTFSDSLDLPAGRVHCVEPDRHLRSALAEQGFHVHAGVSEIGDATISYVVARRPS